MDENKIQTNNKDLKVLRTYTSDMADAVRTNEVSVIKIALAEKERREQEDIYKKAEGTKFSKVFLVIGGIILIAFAIFISYYLIQKKKEKEIPQTNISNIETFISYDSKLYIDTTNIPSTTDILSIIKNENKENPKLIGAIFLTKNIDTAPTILTTNNFLSLFNIAPPGTLTRSLSSEYLLGKYSNKDAINEKSKSAMFLIFQTTDYSQAYASMLLWEKTMLKDLYMLFDIYIPESNNILFEKTWKDTVINNKDVRVLYGDNGEGMLYYVFVNKNNFVITNSIEAMREVITRLLIKNVEM